MPETHTLIIGASHAGAQAAVSLRQSGYSGRITLLGEEKVPPYHRPPLSKDYLSGERDEDDILLRPADSYATAHIELRLGVRAGAIDRDEKTVQTTDGDHIAYDHLVLATGARVRHLPIPGTELPHVFYLRDSTHVDAIRAAVSPGRRAVIIGGGYIGLETAASLRKRGMDVTLLEAQPRILQRVTSPTMSDFYRRVHTEEGVEIVEDCLAASIAQNGAQLTVNTSCERSYEAHMVVIGIGVIPNMELAEFAGLEIADGIAVNDYCQTSDPDIYAIGDVSWHHNPLYDRHMRLESVPNATEQAKIVAAHIMGQPKPYDALPWFWSDQFDLKLQIAGLSDGYDDLVLRGDPDGSRSFAAYYFKGDRLLAVDAVNAPRDFMIARMALSKGRTLDKTILADCDDAALKTALR
ncbi:NAD(P)/FAD-dependent oxidoreductase [Algimonas porphyrae]|uniref:Ferredoxin reductase n=1 Tax=Algimonas porphyrae TaxID=1128113 RepID=A0ABQ5V0M7_9PROT|nr:FAD-dependent oxidoreductase [Algimonas porphyrae]GLQ21105.1 putative ferredoxin reductase [Algimonas porphyrae]